MSAIFSKFLDFVGLNDSSEDQYEYEEDGYGSQDLYQEKNLQPILKDAVVTDAGVRPTMNNVLNVPRDADRQEVIVMKPHSFEEMPKAIQALWERKSVVLNLTMMEPAQAQRAVDFLSGSTYAINGHQERLDDGIFLFTPSSVQITTQSSVDHEVPQSQMSHSHQTSPASIWMQEQTQLAQTA